MITLLKSYTANPTGKDNTIKSRAVMKLAGLSTDEKPLIKFKDIEIENGSSFIEIDTSKIYKYDEENNKWIEQVKGSNKDIIIENNVLLTYINEVTGDDDNNLSDAVATLADGYGRITPEDLALGNNLGDIVLKDTVERIEIGGFLCKKLKSITGLNVITIHAQALELSTVEVVDFPRATSIGTAAFRNCNNLIQVNLPKVISIPIQAFFMCSALESININSVRTLKSAQSFNGCSSLKKINLPSCTVIGATNTFDGCSNLTDIYLPNAESTYTGAPWGATNATIHYNTQFDENGEPILE